MAMSNDTKLELVYDHECPICRTYCRDVNVETWTRTFDGKSFKSHQYEGVGRWEKLLVERFGPLCFSMELVPKEGCRLELVIRGWKAFGVPMLLWLCPRSNSFESVETGHFHFNVEISHPLVGLIVNYRGWLERA
jgi:hypothetical protein